MDNKILAVIAVVAVVAVAGVAVYFVMNQNNNSGGDEDPLAYFDGVGLKVLGNIDGNNVIDQADYNAVKKLIDDGKSIKGNKLADANNDDVLDASDLEIIDKVIKGEKTTIWHINYYDINSDGVMDMQLVDTKIPVVSTIMTGSANAFVLFDLLDIPAGDVVKGACYGSTNDTYLYKNTYLKTALVEKLGSKSYEIPFEDGKIGTSDIIKEKNVTCLVTDWNRIYITNESAFESANVDVVRITAASSDKEVYTHSIYLLGLIFGVTDQAKKIVDLYDSTFKTIADAVATLPADKIRKTVASSTTAAVSSENSDYTAFCLAAGTEFGLEGYDFGGASVIYVSDNPGIFDTRLYNYDNIVHIRTGLTYGSKATEIASSWAEYANGMSLWEHAYDGQVLVSGTIPVPCRVAYIAYAVYHDILPELSQAWADDILSAFETYFDADVSAATNHTLALTSYNYSVTISDDVVVKDKDGKVVESGAKFPYGTELSIAAKNPDADYTLVAYGSNVVDGKFLVINDISAQYVKNSILNALEKAASTLVGEYAGSTYIEKGVANYNNTAGAVAITNTSYSAPDSSRTNVTYFEYYETAEEAKAAFEASKNVKSGPASKEGTAGYNLLDVSSIIGDTENNEIYLVYSGSHTEGKDYTGSTVYVTAYLENIVLMYKSSGYISHYSFDPKYYDMTADEITEHFTEEAMKFAQAIEDALEAGMS